MRAERRKLAKETLCEYHAVPYIGAPRSRGFSARGTSARRIDPWTLPKPDEVLHMPFLQPELGKYSFRVGESDPRSPARVRIYFTAKQRAKNLGNGSAWVDTRTGEVLTMGVSPSKTSFFVDFINVTLEFGDVTPAGPAISRIGFDAGGGFLFFHKRVRGEATLSHYEVK